MKLKKAMNNEFIKNIFSIFSKIYKFKKDDKSSLSSFNDFSDNDGPENYKTISLINNRVQEKLSEEDRANTIKKLLSSQNLKSDGKKLVMLNMYSDCLEIHRLLIPLFKINIDYQIDLVGGCIRDFLNNKHKAITDLDILVSFEINDRWLSYAEYKKNILTREQLIKLEICTKEELDKIGFTDNSEVYQSVNQIISILISREYSNTTKTIFSRDERLTGITQYGGDVLKPVSGIIKVEDKNFNYPLDIIVTDHYKESFLSNIDFGLCNVGFEIFTKDTKNKTNKLNDFKDIRKNFLITENFLKDYHDKTLTLNPDTTDTRQLNISLIHRLDKLEEKYPGYQLVIPNNIEPTAQRTINSILLHKKISNDMNGLKNETENSLTNTDTYKANHKKRKI